MMIVYFGRLQSQEIMQPFILLGRLCYYENYKKIGNEILYIFFLGGYHE